MMVKIGALSQHLKPSLGHPTRHIMSIRRVSNFYLLRPKKKKTAGEKKREHIPVRRPSGTLLNSPSGLVIVCV